MHSNRYIESNRKEIDVLNILADGLAKIAAALEEYFKDPQPFFAGKTKKMVDWVGTQFKAWWAANEPEGRDLCVRLPVLAASIGALNLVGADMQFATPVVSAIVGGQPAITAIKAATKKIPRPSARTARAK